ncbi:MAG: ABC transporter permease [Luteolibacter sp.]
MSLWRMAWRYLWARALVTVLTLTGIALGTSLICSVLTLRRESEAGFLRESGQFDLVAGAKGSPLQLVLSSIYQLDVPTGNIPYSRYEALRDDKRVASAIPLGLGDNFHGYRIVGTEDKLFSLTDRKDAKTPLYRLGSGRFFQSDFEAVIGAQVARQSGLKTGDSFVGTHGLVVTAGSSEHGDFPYKVVGILSDSGSSTDRAIYVSLASVWRIHDKEAEVHRKIAGVGPAAGATSRQELEVTAVLVRLKSVGLRLWMGQEIQKRTEAMAAVPVNEMLRLYQQVLGPMQRILLGVAALVVVVSALSITATLYQSAERRRRDLAVLRALGARRREIFSLVVIEALLLTLLGLSAGWLLGHGGLALAGPYLRDDFGIGVSSWTTDRLEWIALGTVAAGGLIAGFLPAILAYRREPVNDLSSV